MWRRVYFILLLVRLWFALSPSYLHPDENFQGPEVIAGEVFSYPVTYTWEFTAEHPTRSIFPLWLVYGTPMLILRSLWQGLRRDTLPPPIAYWTLRVLMFTLSFVLEDWALLELINSAKQRRIAIILISSSYVTWTYQTHTFSNAIETLIVLWSLVLISRVVEDKERSGAFTCMVLSFLMVLGCFNRITFPAYVLIPSLQLLPHFRRKPLSLLSILFFGILFTFIAVTFDTSFYRPDISTYLDVIRQPVITPLNNFLYNFDPSNLAEHGLHPFYQHAVVNLPLLLGPAILLVLFFWRRSFRLYSAISGVLVLSLFPHQEARFLIPAIPLILSSVRLPQRLSRLWVLAWVVFNAILGAMMGTFHQGGVVPMQMHIAATRDVSQVFWWRTYSPPMWLLDGRIADVRTTDFMGAEEDRLIAALSKAVPACGKNESGVVLVAPASATALDKFSAGEGAKSGLVLKERFRISRHIGLDDLDFAEEGVWGTLNRVWGRRGLVLWNVEKKC